MIHNEPFVHLFRTPGGYYIYDVNKNVVIKTQPDAWKMIMEMQKGCEIKNQKNLIEKMLENGFLSSNRIKEIMHPAEDILMYYLDRKLRMITIQVTQQCNLRCDYCVYSGGYDNRGHSNKKMDFERARKCIDFYIEHSIDSETIIVGFYGGEPLIEFELIKKCIAYIEKISEGKSCIFTITTNGTLLNEEIIVFMKEHGVSLRISLDGPKAIHDKNRKFAFNNCGTFDKIIENLNFIKNKFPGFYKNLTLSTVVDYKNDVSCISNFFSEYETVKSLKIFAAEVTDNYAKDENRTSDEYNSQLRYEHFLELLAKVALFNGKYVSKLVENTNTNLEATYKQLRPTEGLPEKANHGGPCIPGAQRLFVNVDGDMFPCERVSECSEVMKIGNINKGFNQDKVMDLLNIGKLSEEQCKNCWAFRFCTLCSISADAGEELSCSKKISKCKSIRSMAENNLKDICTLKENNFDFGNSNWFVTA